MSKSTFFQDATSNSPKDKKATVKDLLSIGLKINELVNKILLAPFNNMMLYEGQSAEQKKQIDEIMDSKVPQREENFGIFKDRDDIEEHKLDIYEHFIKFTDKIMQTQVAACEEYSYMTLRFLFDEIINQNKFDNIDAEIVMLEDGNHCFVRLFLKDSLTMDSSGWETDKKVLENSVIIDSWLNQVFKATEIRKKLYMAHEDHKNPHLSLYDPKETGMDNTGITLSLLKNSLEYLLQTEKKMEGIQAKK